MSKYLFTREVVYIKSTTIFQKRLKVHMMNEVLNKSSFYDSSTTI